MKLIQRGTVIFEDKDFFNYTNMSTDRDGKAHCYFTDH